MPKDYLISIEEARLLVWELTENIDELKQLLTLPVEVELNKLVSEKRKLEFLGVRVALKELLEKEVLIQYDTNGKPFLTDQSYQISVSHCKNRIAVMAHPALSVGIDIENPTDKIQKLYTRFLSETEQNDLSKGQNIVQLQLAWSAKETLYKIIGKDAVDFANQLRIYSFEVQSSGIFKAEHIATKKIFQLHYIQNSNYTLVYCLDKITN
jgi:4'-phosphopantetheinyl transferase